MLCTHITWVCFLLCKDDGSSPVSLQLLRGLYEVPLSVPLLGFGIGTMLANFYVCGFVFVKSRFKHTREECESKRAYVF